MSKVKKFQPEIENYKVFEYVEFQVGNSKFGISINSVREIIEPIPVTLLPHSHPFVEGIIQLRGEVLPVIDLKIVTGNNGLFDSANSKYIVAEFDGTTVALDVTAVTQIERIIFSEIEVATDMYEGQLVPVRGIIKRGDEMILLVDFEKIISEQFKQPEKRTNLYR